MIFHICFTSAKNSS